MIIKARSRTNGGSLADYLLSVGKFAKNREDNERIEIWEALALEHGDTLHHILQAFEDTALHSLCRKPLYHVQMRTDAGEHLTRQQWLSAVDRLEHRLGLDGHERVIVAHRKDGQEHLHLVFNRMNYETLRAAELRHDGRKRVALARELEREFGLRQLREVGKGRLNEKEQAAATREGKKPEVIKVVIQACYESASNGQEFQNKLAAHGMLVAKGDRREFLIVDRAGMYYGLGRVVGEKAKAVREKLADLDRAALPSVEEAQEQQRKQGRGRKQAVTPDGPACVVPQSRIIVDIAPKPRPPARDDPPSG